MVYTESIAASYPDLSPATSCMLLSASAMSYFMTDSMAMLNMMIL